MTPAQLLVVSEPSGQLEEGLRVIQNQENHEERLAALQHAVVEVAAVSRGASIEETIHRLRSAQRPILAADREDRNPARPR